MAASAPTRARQSVDMMKWLPKASSDQSTKVAGNPTGPKQEAPRVKTTREAEIKLNRLPVADDAGMLDAPDLTTWFYTVNYDKETVKHDYYTETVIKGYTVTIYNDKLEELGKITDTITLEENETKVAKVEVGPQVTKKFFNIDDKYEVMIALSLNTSEFVNHYRTLVYTIGNDTPITTIPGIYVSAINTATDKWAEKFWITFSNEEPTETPEIGGIINTADYVFTTYKSAGYGGMGEPVLVNRLPILATPGEDAIPFLASQKDGMPWFAFNRLKYSWYLDPYDYEVEAPTPDNELQVDIYTLPSAWASALEKYSTTVFPLETTEDDRYFLMLGTFSYHNDLAIDRYGDTPGLILTKANWVGAAEEFNYDYDVYTAAPKGTEGEATHLFNLAKATDGGTFMADIPGADPQVLFIDMDDIEPTFNFVSLLTGEVENSIPYRIANGLYLTAETERVANGDSYLYVASQTHGTSDDAGTMKHPVAYVTPDGRLDHVDTLNLGTNVDMAQVYIASDAFDPFIFNLDDKREYMVLVKRRYPGMTGNVEELMVVSEDTDAAPLLQLGPDNEMGNLAGISFANLGTVNPSLVVVYYNNSDNSYTTVSHPLPLTLFEEGDGSIENPYIINSVGGFEQMRRFPSAHFAIGSDFNAVGHTLAPATFDFTGSLDGRGHIVSNLTVEGRAIIPSMTRSDLTDIDPQVCAVRDINFVNPVFKPTADAQGLLCGSILGGIVENIHVYGGKYTATEDVAGLVGTATLGSRITASSVNASITSATGAAAGIVSGTRTGSSVEACAFSGSLTGAASVGGIVSDAGNVADRIVNCHVNADITGQNTIGGIVATSSRALVANCHVQGTITATAPARWGGGLKTGGIVGQLAQWYPSENETEQPEGAVVKGCLVSLKSMTGVEVPEGDYTGQNDTMHRIIGASSVNNTPEETGYDSATDKPIYGELQPVENALADNYAVDTLAPLSGEAGADTTEGASIATADITLDFLKGIGYEYGDETAEPWSLTGTPSEPALWYEGGLLMFTTATASVVENEECTLQIELAGQEITDDMLDSFTCDISDETVLEMTGAELTAGKVTITFKGLKPGQATVTAGLNGKTATAEVTVTKFDAVTEVTAPSSAITYDGRVARAEGCTLNVYATDGAMLLSGRDNADLSGLAGGVYIITATDNDGNRSSLKVRR